MKSRRQKKVDVLLEFFYIFQIFSLTEKLITRCQATLLQLHTPSLKKPDISNIVPRPNSTYNFAPFRKTINIYDYGLVLQCTIIFPCFNRYQQMSLPSHNLLLLSQKQAHDKTGTAKYSVNCLCFVVDDRIENVNLLRDSTCYLPAIAALGGNSSRKPYC